jgi:hypothetical protein
LPTWLSCAEQVITHNSERIAAVHINLIVVPTRVSSSEVEIKSHQITIVDRVFAAHRRGCDIDDA